jgi:uncharacterized protein (DUF2249 family)
MLDLREVPCSLKHGWILRTFVALKPGEHFILRNGHDPVPLRYQFEAEFPGAFDWDYVHRLPEDVAVKISKTRELPANQGSLPGHCGGH